MHQIRLKNLIALESGFYRKKDFADAIGVSAPYVRHLKTSERSINEKTARKIETRLKLKFGHMDAIHDSELSVNVINEDQDVLILLSNPNDTEKLAMDGEYVKQSWLDNHGYSVKDLSAFTIKHSNMSPEYEIGDRVLVHKSGAQVYKNNTNYLFSISDDEYIIFKVYKRISGDLLLSSLNKDERPDELVKAEDIDALDCRGLVVKLIRYF